jgi:Holliday junction resolvase RusA-like endonuclease
MDLKIVSFSIPGPPVGKGRPKFARRGKFVATYTPEKTVSFENLVKMSYPDDAGMFDGPVKIVVRSYFQIPKSIPKKLIELYGSESAYTTKKPDADNLVKSVLDGLNGIAYKDDSCVCKLIFEKRYSPKPRTDVELTYAT